MFSHTWHSAWADRHHADVRPSRSWLPALFLRISGLDYSRCPTKSACLSNGMVLVRVHRRLAHSRFRGCRLVRTACGPGWHTVGGTAFVVAGGLTLLIGVREPRGAKRLVSTEEEALTALWHSISLLWRKPKTAIACLTRVINTAPEFGFLVFCRHSSCIPSAFPSSDGCTF